ncbi:hypothetical protein [Paraburkholderia bannensis]|uniref:hypothetical protein n=1 Tax=Paraburkholderia bannensis TaxID=765414 RepID=UPI000A8A37A2|nr:hypothetical protein [Paraburkholderia bannensis]
MKNLYARFVLFLIRPAVQRALHEGLKQGGKHLPNRVIVSGWSADDSRLTEKISLSVRAAVAERERAGA